MTVKEKILAFRERTKKLRPARILANTILGEFDRVSKDPTDEQCIQVIKKMMESNKLTGNLDENEILETFLPKQLTESEIKEIIETMKFDSIMLCMGFFKSNYPGLYNGKVVSNIFKEWKK